MFSSWVGIPKGSVLAPKHHQVAGPERPAEGWGGSSCAAHRLLAHIKNPFRVIGWQGSSDFPPLGLVHGIQIKQPPGSSHQESDRE